MLTEHTIEIRVRYSETDAMGFLHHGNFANYYEMGRTELLREQGGNYREIEESGLFLVVVRLDCRFHSPAKYDDLLMLTTRVDRVTPVRIEHAYELRRDGQLLASAKSTLACVDRAGQIQRIPESLGTAPE